MWTALTLAVSVASFGQVAGDFPTLGGSGARLGHNGIPNTTGPGRSILHWFDPPILYNATTRLNEPATIKIDNTDTASTRHDCPTQGPFDPPPYGSRVVSPFYTPLIPNPDPANAWAWPAIEDEAGFPYLLPVRRVGLPLPPDPVVYPANNNYRYPAYLYTRATPSLSRNQPWLAKNAADLRYFRYIINGKPQVQQNYAISVWIPQGSTRRAGTYIFPQRYYVYEVRFGPNGSQKYYDVIDTYAAGNGWVRIGNGGGPTNMVFPWDGTNPIQVYLYNTVPRNNDGSLTMPHPVNNEDAVKNYLVYADACMAVPAIGNYTATPVSARTDPGNAASQLLIDARNEYSVSRDGTGNRTIERGVVTTRTYNTLTKLWDRLWRFAPSEETGDTNRIVDNTAAATSGPFVVDTTLKRYAGPDVYVAGLQAAQTGRVTYDYPGVDGYYEVYAYVPGNNNGFQFGTGVRYEVEAEGTVYTFTVDQSLAQGWVRLGNRRFQHSTTAALFQPLRVTVTNESAVPTDLTKFAYADAIRFVGDKNQAITSTPVYATARVRKTGGIIEDTNVVIVSDEDGRIHCLDAAGNGDGTTTEYWAYPSTVDPDPNQVDTEDGVGGVAEMPSGFDLSTGLVQRVGTEDFFFIGSNNGRVYCIEMLGRGDYSDKVAGTTRRKWTYPNTFPSPDPVAVSSLGSFRGSLSFGTTSNGPTLFVPTTQGRLYALNANGNALNKTTVARWTFPAMNQPTLGPIWSTPTYFRSNPTNIDTAKVFFGTLMNDEDQGRFYSLNAATGAVNWEVGAVNPAMPTPGHFLGSPAVVPYKTLQNSALAPDGGVIYVPNQNQFVYAMDADTGVMQWVTSELKTGVRGSLTFQRMTVYNNAGLLESAPVIMVPTLKGTFTGLYADATTNRYGTKRAWEYQTEADNITASTSNATGWTFGGDSVGYLYAFQNNAGGYGSNQMFPGQETITENNPIGDIFRKAKIRFITKAAYQSLRYPTGDAQQMSYSQALSAANMVTRPAFEWGETVYVLVHDFPYKTTATDDTTIVPPPTVNIAFSADGSPGRPIPIESRQFKTVNPGVDPPLLKNIQPDPGTPTDALGGTLPVDGYAIMAFPFQGGGSNAIPPGNVTASFTIRTQSLNANGVDQVVALRPDISQYSFQMANPIAISMKPNPNDNSGSLFAMGYDIDPTKPERLVNGSTGAKALIGTTTGWAQHGQSKSTTFYVYDVSMMGLLRPDGIGLENVRVTRDDLERQGGAAAVWKPIDQALYPRFEDLPVNSPNTSLDYPNIARENIRVTKDPGGDSENPIFNGVSLKAALIRDGAVTRQMQEGDLPYGGSTVRVFQGTPFEVNVDVPKYQPPVDPSKFIHTPNSEGVDMIQGYMGRLRVFVDTVQNGNVDVVSREPYRSFNLASAVAVDEKIGVTTPTVDLGSLPTGAGYTWIAFPGFGYNTSGPQDRRIFQPWGGNYANPTGVNLWKEINVTNDGNVNLLNLRVAKADATGGSFLPWWFGAQANDPRAALEAGWLTDSTNMFSGNLWSDLDWQFSPWSAAANPSRQVILQKPRVTDRVPTSLTVNPVRRTNPNIQSTQSPRFNATRFPVQAPRVAVTVPLGFPSGRYGQRMKVIEDSIAPLTDLTPTWDILGSGYESASDPTFDIFFNVREARLTNSYTAGADRQIDDILPGGTSTTSTYANQMPSGVRDPFGSLMLAWSSNRPAWNLDETIPADTDRPFRIYISTLDSQWSFTSAMNGPAGQNPTLPLRDLNNWAPAVGRWWKHQVLNYPRGNPNQWFGSNRGEGILPGTVRYIYPSFPQQGFRKPFVQAGPPFDGSSIYTGTYMGFIGEAQKSTPTGRIAESRLLMTVVTTTDDGTVTTSDPIPLTIDPTTAKGKPSIVQTDSGAMVFFSGVSAGQSRVYYTRLEGQAFQIYAALPFGGGFDSVTSPSASPRMYTGANGSHAVVDLTFSGRLRGRPAAEVFTGRLGAFTSGGAQGVTSDRLAEVLDASGHPVLDPDRAFDWQAVQVDERLVPEESGVYRARGVVWNLNAGRGFILSQANGTNRLNVLLDGYDAGGTYTAANDTRQYDATTGILSFDTRLGGKAYIDPAIGQVRFTGGLPPRTANLLLTYQPRFVRVTAGGPAAYSGSTGLFDSRLVSSTAGWWRSANVPATMTDDIRNDRLIFTYTRAASGTGQAARPYMSTLRFGVRLTDPVSGEALRIATDTNGNPISPVTVTGNSGFYQLDPAQARVYFTAFDEDRTVSITFPAMNDAGASRGVVTLTNLRVSLVGERAEEVVPIEQAVNESGLSPFLDPFNYLSAADRRPPLVWMFWTSTRSGGPDLYFQTIAPNWSPITIGR
jgi:hypothetical protein